MNIPEGIINHAKRIINDPFITYDKKELAEVRERCLYQIREYKKLKSIIAENEKAVNEITNWLKEVEIKIANPEEISIIKEKFTR